MKGFILARDPPSRPRALRKIIVCVNGFWLNNEAGRLNGEAKTSADGETAAGRKDFGGRCLKVGVKRAVLEQTDGVTV